MLRPFGPQITYKILPRPFGPQNYLQNFTAALRATKLPAKFCRRPTGHKITYTISPRPFGSQNYLHHFATTLRATKLPAKFRRGPTGHKITYQILPRPFGPQNYLRNFAAALWVTKLPTKFRHSRRGQNYIRTYQPSHTSTTVQKRNVPGCVISTLQGSLQPEKPCQSHSTRHADQSYTSSWESSSTPWEQVPLPGLQDQVEDQAMMAGDFRALRVEAIALQKGPPHRSKKQPEEEVGQKVRNA